MFSSPTGTEMFHFPVSTSTPAIHSLAGNHTSLRLGFPIRTSSDQRLVGNSPRHNAASHVLHRLDMPRHPPCALQNNKQNTKPNHQQGQASPMFGRVRYHTTKNKKIKMLASTIQFSHNTPPPPQPKNTTFSTRVDDARC